MILYSVMTEVSAAIDAITGLRCYAFPVLNVSPPAAVVLFPNRYVYDETYGRGMDRMTLQVAVMVGRANERTAAKALSGYLDGASATSIKQAVENGTYTSLDTVRVESVDVDVMTMDGIDYLAAVFNLDIAGGQ